MIDGCDMYVCSNMSQKATNREQQRVSYTSHCRALPVRGEDIGPLQYHERDIA